MNIKELQEKIKEMKLNSYLFLNVHWKKQAEKLRGRAVYEIYNQAIDDILKLLDSINGKKTK